MIKYLLSCLIIILINYQIVDYIKKAYKEHKNISSYTKWFNSIPLLGVGALGVYGYENTNE